MAIHQSDLASEEETQAVREAAAVSRSPRPRKRRWWRWPVRLVVAGGLVLLLGVALLPTLISSGPGTRWVTQQVNARIPGTVELDDLKLGWIRGQGLEGLRLRDPAGDTVASLERVTLHDVGLLRLLGGSADLGAVQIEQGVLDVVQDETGRTNLDEALGTSWFVTRKDMPGTGTTGPVTKPSPPPASPDTDAPQKKTAKRSVGAPMLPSDLALQFVLRDVMVSMTGPTIQPVRIIFSEATLTANSPARLGFTLDATVIQALDQGAATLAGTVQDLFDPDGRLTLPDAQFDVQGLIDALPLAAVDRVTAGEGRLETVLGPTLDGELKIKGNRDDLDAWVTVQSRHLNIQQRLSADPKRVQGVGDSASSLEVTPASWALLAGAAAGQETPTLAEPFRLEFRVDALDAPHAGRSFDWAATRFNARVRLTDGDRVVLDVPGKGRVEATQWSAELSSESADRAVGLRLGGEVDAYGVAGPVSAEVELRRGAGGWDKFEVEGVLWSLPVPVVDALLGQGDRLTATFGPRVGLGLLAASDGEGGYALTADFDRDDAGPPDGSSPPTTESRLSGSLTGRYEADGTVAFKTEQPVRLTMSPKAFAAWQQPVAEAVEVGESVGLSLTQPMDVVANVDVQVALSEGGGLRFDPERTRALLDVTLPETRVVDEWYRRAFSLQNGKLVIDAPDLRQPVSVSFTFQTVPGRGDSTSGMRPGRVDAEARVTGLMLDDGYIQIERGRVSSLIEFDRVPTVVFDALIRQRGYAVAAFGAEVNTTIEIDDWQLGEGGAIAFEFQSANGSVGSFRGVDDGEQFKPDGPMTFHLNQTPELAGRIMRWVNPVLLPAVRAANVPMTITIDDDTFRLPTRGFSWEQFDADVQVQMGTVTISPNVSPVNKILPPLQSLGLIDRQVEYQAKVSPIALSIRDGVFSYEDLTFRIGDVTLPFSGRISFVDQSIDLRMGLEGRVAEKNPWVLALVGDGVRIGGTVQDPVVDLNPLRGFQERPAETFGNLLGDLFGPSRNKTQPPAPPAPPDPSPPVDAPASPEADPASPSAEPEDPPPADDAADAPKPESIEEVFTGLLGGFLEREIRRAQEKQQDPPPPDR
ncbi:MAG: hypothetical protein AAGG38_02920 [Planctomycetota bacterium]